MAITEPLETLGDDVYVDDLSHVDKAPSYASYGRSPTDRRSPDQTPKAASAVDFLHALGCSVSSALRERLKKERIMTQSDVIGLDKEDLRELGLTMVDRSKVLRAKESRFEHSITPAQYGYSRQRSISQNFDDGIDFNMVARGESPRHSSGGMGCVPATPVMGMPPKRPSDTGMKYFGRCSSGNIDEDDIEAQRQENEAAEELTLQKLDEVESNADFWFQLVRRGDKRAEFSHQLDKLEKDLRSSSQKGVVFNDIRENVLEKMFDVSPERLKEVYESVDKDSDGHIQEEELKEALHRCELLGLDDALHKVLKMASTTKTNALQLVEFESVLTRLKLAQLLSDKKYQQPMDSIDQPKPSGNRLSLALLDYNLQKVEPPTGTLRDYFFGHRGKEFPIRWVHLRQLELPLFLALTVKYQLHPLSVEDTLEQAPTKLDRNEGHYFLSIEHLRAIPTEGKVYNGDAPVKVRGRHIAVFCSGPPHLDTIITVAQEDRSFAEDWPGDTPKEALGPDNDDWVNQLHKRLKQKMSRTRERRADFLMYEIIDLCSDALAALTRAYTLRMNYLEKMFFDRFHIQASANNAGAVDMDIEKNKKEWFTEIGTIKLQLAVVARRLRGLQRVIRRLQDDADITPTLKGYLQDVADHVVESYEDSNHLIEKCSTLSNTYEHTEEKAQQLAHLEQARAQALQDERMNKMLFALTILTTIFTPLTFMAGVYGMNFTNGDTPTIPELLMPDGYFIFMGCSLIYLIISSIVGIHCWRKMTRKGDEKGQHAQSCRASSNGAAYVTVCGSPSQVTASSGTNTAPAYPPRDHSNYQLLRASS